MARLIRSVPMGMRVGILHSTEAILSTVSTKLIQRYVEVMLVFPLNV